MKSQINIENLWIYKYIILITFLVLACAYVFFFEWNSFVLMIAALFGIYMAMNIGANDVANNMGPAVWAWAISLWWAIVIAAIFEAGWAIIAGGDVVGTVKSGIIDPAMITDSNDYIAIMMATLVWAALWINIATYLKAPVSATHSVIGGLIGAWVAWAWASIVDWSQISSIVASWIISPLMGWCIAAIITVAISKTILEKDDRSQSAKTWVPIYVWVMTWAFCAYLIMKWLKNILPEISLLWAIGIGFVIALIVTIAMLIHLKSKNFILKNSKKAINHLFNVPLVFAVALLSFAHGANDVANAIGPLAWVVDVVRSQWINWSVGIPLWVMLLGAAGLSIGLMIFGARLIRTVGSEITKLNQSRAFAVALAAAVTVIVASQLGLPVSSTHIAIGWIFGVGFVRQYMKYRSWIQKSYVEKSMIKNIALAWVITLPVSALIAAGMFYVISYTL